VTPADPSLGAGRREGVLLAAFGVLTLVGLWTVVVAELGDDTPPQQNVTAPTEKPAADTK
jgi:hypothetical protein